MKKLFICLAIFLTAGIALNQNSYAESCITSLPNVLQACFNSAQLALTVTVSGNVATIDGTLSGASQANEMQQCIDNYNDGAASCPGAPVVVFGTISSTTLTNIYGRR